MIKILLSTVLSLTILGSSEATADYPYININDTCDFVITGTQKVKKALERVESVEDEFYVFMDKIIKALEDIKDLELREQIFALLMKIVSDYEKACIR